VPGWWVSISSAFFYATILFVRIAYCTNVRLPSERAHGHQIAQVSAALDALGHEMTVYAPLRRNPVKEIFNDYYNVSDSVLLRYIRVFDPINRWWIPGPFSLWLLNYLIRPELKRDIEVMNPELLYTRAPALLGTLLSTGVPVILELHSLPRINRILFADRCNRCAMVVCLTNAMHETLLSWGIDETKLMTEGDGVDLHRFEVQHDPQAMKDLLELPKDRLIVGYAGRLKTLGMEKGVKYLLESLAQLKPSKRFFGFIIGGPDGDTEEYRRMAVKLGLTADDVRFTGEVPASHIPGMLAACDMFTMPFPDLPHYRHHMSPLKMFEYMAAKRPIITSDLPTIRDVLSEKHAYFCTPGDTASLTKAITHVADNPAEAKAKVEEVSRLVTHYSWEKRMERILIAAGFPQP